MSLRDIMNISRWWVHVTPIVIHWKLRWNHPKTEDVVTYPYHGWMTLSLTWPPHWSRKILVTSGIEWVWHLLLSDPYFGYILDRVTSSSIEPQLWKAVSHLEKSRIFFFFEISIQLDVFVFFLSFFSPLSLLDACMVLLKYKWIRRWNLPCSASIWIKFYLPNDADCPFHTDDRWHNQRYKTGLMLVFMYLLLTITFFFLKGEGGGSLSMV